MVNQAKQVLVSFSKRRKGLFQKASELCTKFDAQIAVLVVSAAGNPFAFGHSSVDQVLGRATTASHGVGIAIDDAIDEETLRFKAQELEGLKVRVKTIKEVGDAFEAWIEREVEACETLEELEILKDKCLALRKKIAEKLRNHPSVFGSEGFGFHGDDDDVLDFSCLFGDDDHGCDDILVGVQNDVSFSVKKSDCKGGAKRLSSLPGYFGLWDGPQEQNGMSFPVVKAECEGDAKQYLGLLCGPQEQNDASFSVMKCEYSGEVVNNQSFMPEYSYLRGPQERNDGSFSLWECDYNCGTSSTGVGVTMDHENDSSFMADGSASGSAGTASDDHVFNFLGQISCGIDEEFWDTLLDL